MRRKPGTILPIERELLTAAANLFVSGAQEFHGFLIAHEMRDRSGAQDLIAYGNLYRILERMEKAGLLESRWEDPLEAAEARRPRRRLYRLTPLGQSAAKEGPAPRPLTPRLAEA
jgi:DNA-binding PadR family transcriptional regulator